jgi:hypothetical protein
MEIWNYLNQHFDLPQLIAFGVMLWVLKSLMEKNLDKKFESIDKRFDKLEGRVSKIENDMIEVKTILRMKECCMIQDERKLPKVE